MRLIDAIELWFLGFGTGFIVAFWIADRIRRKAYGDGRTD